MPFKRKLMNQTWEHAKKPNLESDFGPFGPNLGKKHFLWVLPVLDVRHCRKLSSNSISRQNLWFKLKKMAKCLILGLIYARWVQIQAAKIFL